MPISVVTGAAGFIGSHLVEALLQRGDRVIGVDQFNTYYDPALKERNMAGFRHHANFQLIHADIQALDWPEMLQDVDVLYHQAAQAGVRSSWGAGFRTYTEQNVNATQILLEAAKTANLKRLVFASSSSIYGDAEAMPTAETLCPRPVSPYGITKLAAEQLCGLYYRNFGVPVTVLRYFTVYGPRQRPDMGFHKFFKAVLAERAIEIYGDGQQTRDFTFVADAIAANLAAAHVSAAVGEVFNIGGGSRIKLTEVLDTMEMIVDRPIQRHYIAQAIGDARHTAANVAKAQKVLGYQPQINLKAGLIAQWQWVQELYR